MTFADPPPGLHANAVSYGPALNVAAVPVSGEKWPWGDPHAYPYRPHRVGGNGEVFLRGAEKLGITAKVGPFGDCQRPVRQPAALHLPRLLPAGLQGQRR